MNTMKVFPTATMTTEVFKRLLLYNFQDAQYWEYAVGAFVCEAEDDKSYYKEDVEKAKIIDA